MTAKPLIAALPLACLPRLNLAGSLCQEKSDGQHEFLPWSGHVFNSELMADGSHVVNDVVALFGQDCTALATRTRWDELGALAAGFGPGIRLSRILPGAGEIEAHIAAGGEGAVIKDLAAPFGAGWGKLKRAENFFCRVVTLDPSRGSVTLADIATGQARGQLPLRGKFDRVAGLVARGEKFTLKIVAFGAHKSGLLREARLDTDSPDSWILMP